MPLDGINRLCENCSEECRQWKQVKVIRCPFYNPANSKHDDLAETGQGL